MTPSSVETTWAEIPGWPGYRVSSGGTVQTRKDCAGLDSGCWVDRSPIVDKDGYQKITLTHRRRTVYIGVHTLVLICHGPPRPPGKSMALHGNGDRQDNGLANLRWGFGSDNADDRDHHGTTARFETNGNAKLTWDEVNAIRSQRDSLGTSLSSLAKQFGISKKAVLNIVQRKTWNEGRQLTQGVEGSP